MSSFDAMLSPHDVRGVDSPVVGDNQERCWEEPRRVMDATVATDLETDDKDLK